jgi:quercetin dioxygenase-like cupin family protein
VADAGWQLLRIDDVEPIDVAGVHWRPLRRTLGVHAFGINAYTAAAGEDVVERHTEETLGHEEIYLVLSGRATFTLGEETVEAAAGSLVFIRDPLVRRHARADEDGTTVVAIGGKAGDAYTPSAWEAFFATERFRASSDHASAIMELEQALEAHPDHAGIVYTLGCWKAMAGEADDALALVQRATELDERYAEWAKKDDDLASIRDRLA